MKKLLIPLMCLCSTLSFGGTVTVETTDDKKLNCPSYVKVYGQMFGQARADHTLNLCRISHIQSNVVYMDSYSPSARTGYDRDYFIVYGVGDTDKILQRLPYAQIATESVLDQPED